MPDLEDTGRLFGRQSAYDFKYRVFPEDLGKEDMSHYMVININVPTKTSGSTTPKGELPTGSLLAGELSKVDQLRLGRNGQLNIGGIEIPNPPIGGPGGAGTILPEGTTFGDIPGFNAIEGLLAPERRTTRIKESVALHMPNGGLVYTENNKYEEVSMTAVATGVVSTGLGLLPGIGSTARSLFDGAVSAVKRTAQLEGYPINPAVEVLFAARPQRQWMFEVFLLPRSETEVNTVKEIIRTLRYHAAPEIILNGFAFVPPAEFDITFFQAGKENTNLPRINTCVLDRIDVDYSPEQSFSTFVNGHPTAVRLSMGFREVEILHKERVYQGF